MFLLDLEPSRDDLGAGAKYLIGNEYPGRVAIMGLSQDSQSLIQAYILTGRSESSRLRVFTSEEDGYRVVPVEYSSETGKPAIALEAEFDPLRHYKASKYGRGVFAVSNGAQTDHVWHNSYIDFTLEAAMRYCPIVPIVEIENKVDKTEKIDLAKYEPDAPNFTSRIAGVINFHEDAPTKFGLAVARRRNDSHATSYEIYEAPAIEALPAGVGYAVQTYRRNAPPGVPLPTFDLDPYTIPLDGEADETGAVIWNMLHPEYKVAILVQAIDIGSQAIRSTFTRSIHDPIAA